MMLPWAYIGGGRKRATKNNDSFRSRYSRTSISGVSISGEWGFLDSILNEKSMVTNDKLITSYTICIGNITGLVECSPARAPPLIEVLLYLLTPLF